ncbi:glycosyl hydrolase family 28-related protein [Micromonosporaceae bacterium Da 78-11]
MSDTAAITYSVRQNGDVRADGSTDDTAALQAAIDASPVGSTVFFPAGTYLVSAPIVLLPERAYLGGGHATAGTAATIKQRDGADITNAAGLSGLLVPRTWADDGTHCDLPVRITNLAVDGNKAGNPGSTACGIVLVNFWSVIEGCYLYDVPRHAVHLTDVTANGKNTITNSASENRVVGCKIVAPGGDGINQLSTNRTSNLDGFCADNLISDVGGGGIVFQRSAGWVFRRNHLYGIAGDAIDLGNSFATVCEHNYIEDFGGANGDGTYYAGISFDQLDGRGTVLHGNSVSCAEPAAKKSCYHLIRAGAGSGQTDAKAVITGNLLDGNDGAEGIGILTQHADHGILTAVIAGNIVTAVRTPYHVTGGDQVGTVNAGSQEIAGLLTMRGHESSEGAPAVTVLAGGSASAASTVGPAYANDIAGHLSATAFATGDVAIVTFGNAYPATPRTVTLTPTNAEAAAAQLYVSAQTTTGFTVACGATPAAAQALTFAYRITA